MSENIFQHLYIQGNLQHIHGFKEHLSPNKEIKICHRLSKMFSFSISGVPLVSAERGGGGLQGGGLGGALGGALVATGVAAAAVWMRLYKSRRLGQTRGGKTLRLEHPAEDTRPMLRSGEHRDL